MSRLVCPDCDGVMSCLAGCSAHPDNWYCEDEDGCGYQAWNARASKEAVNLKEAASTISFDLDEMKRYQRLKPVQDKLDAAGRTIYVIDYINVRSPAEFMCKVCQHRWKVKRAKYVTQQDRGCPECNRGGRSNKKKPIKKRIKNAIIKNESNTPSIADFDANPDTGL